MGFLIESAGSTMADIPFQSNYDGPGQDRVILTRDLPLRLGLNQDSNAISDQVASQVALIRRFYHEMWNRFDKTVIPELLSTDIRFRGSLGQSKVGHEQFGEYVDFIRAAFPDFSNRIETIVSEAGMSFARLSYTGTHAGELFGVPATDRRVRYAGAALFQFRDGLIAEVWVLGDIHGLLRQIQETPDHG